ncbi:ABC transporter substrate-binding protein [Prescottella defluvii]|nr:ABC transporter substrate-binding protein [Prescottella defluvii]
MQSIDLAYVGHGLHEELIAYVADQEGCYEDAGVHVAIRDGVGWETERLRRGATIGLGRTLLSRMTDGIGWTVLSVNTHRPLFWFLSSASVTSMAHLRGRRLAVHAAHTAPGCFARIVLRKHGLDPTVTWNVWRGIRVTTRWTCDAFGTARSTQPTWAARSRPNRSPRKRVPPAGLGRRSLPDPDRGRRRGPVHVPLDSPALQALVRANQRALRTLDEQPALAVDYIASFLNRLTREEAQQYYERYIGPYFTPDGRVDLDIAQRAIDSVAAELGVEAVDANTVYGPSA